MTNHKLHSTWLAGLLGVLGLTATAPAAAPAVSSPIDFNRDVRPLLSDNCFHCHGPDAGTRKARLRLDRRDDALRPLRGGGFALVPGDRSRSAIYERAASADGHDRMPPARSGKKLTPAQIDRLGRWIDQGARWDDHWSYAPLRRPGVPNVRDSRWPHNAIDRFVLHRLEKEGLTPASEADRPTLLRRLSLDLTGLPPTPAEREAFLSDRGPDAVEKVVDRLLASPHYGERMASGWLDLARCADTNGYRLDNHRDVWQYRDWVIDAYNRNMPFDRFTVEQLAGDLLPGATLKQKIATGFHRNTMINHGNGSDPADYLSRAVMDRVATTATVWLGTTLACAACHDHKYDPFTQKDYYRLYAFFHNVPEKGLGGARGNPDPVIPTPSPAQARRLDELRARRARLTPGSAAERRLQKAEADLREAIPTVMVMEEMPTPRTTRVMIRGEYRNLGEVVTAGVPASLPPLPAGAPANRLGLARWLVDGRNPLTARVTVNRIWQTLQGAGIVRTPDDFGAQGEAPSHPELLDWLAAEFIASGWDVKALQRKIVLSATYRQSSATSPGLRDRDPDNRLLARGSRFRLDAELIRDNALAVSGLLVPGVGGPSVRPHQPAGLWEQVAVGGPYSSQTYVPGTGTDLYRRGLYTYWKRSMPHPSLVAFDAPTREACVAGRPRTNTPLQALVLMNDPAFLEAAGALARRALRDGGSTPQDRLTAAFRLCLARTATASEKEVLLRVHAQMLDHYRHDRKAAAALVRVGAAGLPAGVDESELAAWTAIASLLLNLDETITRE